VTLRSNVFNQKDLVDATFLVVKMAPDTRPAVADYIIRVMDGAADDARYSDGLNFELELIQCFESGVAVSY